MTPPVKLSRCVPHAETIKALIAKGKADPATLPARMILQPGAARREEPGRLRRRSLAALAPLVALLAGPARAQQPAPLTVFAAASLQDALRALEPAWRAAAPGNPPLRLAFAASSALARQIEQGAPADLFMSADEPWMDYLAQRDLILSGDPQQPARQCAGAGRAGRRPGPAGHARPWHRPRRAARAGGAAGDRRSGACPGRPLRPGRAGMDGPVAGAVAPPRPRRQCPLGAAAGRAGRGAARHRLPDRCQGQPGRARHRHLPGGEPPAGDLPLRGRRAGRPPRARRAKTRRARCWTSSPAPAPRRPGSASASP